ncbi:hypothetical protein FV228_29360 [Methylobacterium sp. WL18]|uniref:hypothetical protein n=1 Tax=Methylobacterium sp. WL18 TaxID=2603897 RepID=UPI0011C7559D|nr:hypothetical protein [Methylobacterium sp. WL18]TXN50845.1 hypothetical protein FV228_29360 [Methylobacterium sp. WL18]
MTKRREAGRTTPHADTLPEQAAVERAIEAVLDRLRPKDHPGTKDRQDAKDRPHPKSAGRTTSRPPAAEATRKPGPGRKAD